MDRHTRANTNDQIKSNGMIECVCAEDEGGNMGGG